MTDHPTFPYLAQTELAGIAYPAVQALLLHEAEEHDLELSENSDSRVALMTEYGQLIFDAMEGGVVAAVHSQSEENLFILKESLQESISHFAPELADQMSWSDAGARTGFPPNFQLVTVLSATPLGSNFMRVVVQADDLKNYTDAAIHFRIVLPPAGDDAPQWPAVNDKGVTVWPKGEKALHRPVYTARSVDHDTNRLTFDVFVHEGGRTTDWATSVVPGTKMGLTGPGGGGVPDVAAIAIYADDTGFPAVARMLETLPQETTGRVVLLSAAGASSGYPMPEHANLKPEWHSAATLESLADLALSEREAYADHMLWFAAEKQDVQKMRRFFKDAGLNAKAHYLAAYWGR
ncbi:siderophore-interacting protein [Shimia sp. R10_1]|uniref:siderophore-interacting protein n=1 Tax=Shimia sp. R10_1 TaxID=2821095 RepID=UPI001ADA5DA3|nr:siderophore-interacting protein [Shimia sp. R10_1]MBO9474209.1 siderophore-interacting protein [Shimia sp. R10_1]